MSSVADKSSTAKTPPGPDREPSRTAPTEASRGVGAPPSVPARRHYDAQASRGALLRAASELFDERGYDAATLRDIGDRAGVDAALIARYFGGKEGLYLATVQQQAVGTRLPVEPARALEHMLRRSEERGSGPVGLALVSPTLSDAMREQVREIVGTRVVEPLAAALAARGAADAELRAELLVAIASGVTLTRAAGALPALAAASLDDVLEVLEPLADALQA